jgi:hypothetical protein
MKLIEAYNLLVEDGVANNHRFFSELYKHYGFDDDRMLKEYLDFIEHEPVAWLRGFPAKLTTKLAFAKPKTAVIKLLKKHAVIQALGQEYAIQLHDIVWNTFKREAEAIVTERLTNQDTQRQEDIKDMCNQQDDAFSVGSLETYESLPTPPMKTFKTIHIQQPKITIQETMEPVTFEKDKDNKDNRVEFLKSVLLKMSVTLPDGVRDAFQLLVSRV